MATTCPMSGSIFPVTSATRSTGTLNNWFTEGFRAERDEARALMDRAAHQMTGRLGIMTEQELTDQRLRQRSESRSSVGS